MERKRETTFSSHNKHNGFYLYVFPILELPDEERNLDLGVEDLLNVNNIIPNNDEDAVNLSISVIERLSISVIIE